MENVHPKTSLAGGTKGTCYFSLFKQVNELGM